MSQYNKEFEDWWFSYSVDIFCSDAEKRSAFHSWEAARKDCYNIGEEVVARFSNGDEFEKGRVCVSVSGECWGGYISYNEKNVKRSNEVEEVKQDTNRHKKYSTPEKLIDILNNHIEYINQAIWNETYKHQKSAETHEMELDKRNVELALMGLGCKMCKCGTWSLKDYCSTRCEKKAQG